MKVGRGKLIVELTRLWPALQLGCHGGGNIWLADDAYWAVSFCKLFELVKDFSVDSPEFIHQINDCDDFAHRLHGAFMDERRRVYSDEGKETFPYAMGECWGSKFKGKSTHHAVNIAWAKDKGVVLIEPQTAEIWIADKKDDQPYYARF